MTALMSYGKMQHRPNKISTRYPQHFTNNFFFFTLIHLKHQLLSLLSKVLERAVYKSVISQSYSEQSPGLKTVHSTDTAHVAVIPMRQAYRSVELRSHHHPDPS